MKHPHSPANLESLTDILAAVRADYPDLSRQPGRRFKAAWRQAVDRVYDAGTEDLLDLLTANQAVVSLACGPLGQPYQQRARANVARIHARFGLPWPSECTEALQKEDEEPCLHWLVDWSAGSYIPPAAPPSRVRAPAWEQTVLDGYRFLGEEDDPEALVAYSNPDSSASRSNSLLGYVKRLVRLKAARRLADLERHQEARPLAVACGRDGQRLLMQIDHAQPNPDTPSASERRRISRYHAYHCRRLASRSSLLGLDGARLFYEAAAQDWNHLAELAIGEP